MQVITLAALAVMLIGSIIIMVQAFSESILWGLAYLFIPFASLAFVITHWQTTRKPFLAIVGAAAAMFLSAAVMTP